MKKIFVLFIILFSMLCCSCANEERVLEVGEKNYMHDYPYMEIIEMRDGADTRVYLMYDKETKVEYFVEHSNYYTAITPRYDSNGKVILYEGK